MAVERIPGDAPERVFHQMAEIHREAIREGFLSSFGDEFLASLYRSVAAGPASFAFGAFEEGRLEGFVAGAVDTGAVYRQFARRAGLRGALKVAARVASPRRLFRALETLLYPSRKGDGLPGPEILNFCVRPGTQGKGVGGGLFAALEAEFRARGVAEIRIVTGEGQVSAQRFYEKRGATLAASTEVHKGEASRVYRYAIGSGPAGAGR